MEPKTMATSMSSFSGAKASNNMAPQKQGLLQIEWVQVKHYGGKLK
jgi:hypothetical protein